MPSDAPTAEPPPPPPSDEGTDRAGIGLRLLAVLGALVLAFGAAVMIIVAIDLADTRTCEDLIGDVITGQTTVDFGDECFDGGSTEKSISVALSWASGLAAVLAVLAALAFAIRGRGGRLALQLTGAAIAFAALTLAVGGV